MTLVTGDSVRLIIVSRCVFCLRSESEDAERASLAVPSEDTEVVD